MQIGFASGPLRNIYIYRQLIWTNIHTHIKPWIQILNICREGNPSSCFCFVGRNDFQLSIVMYKRSFKNIVCSECNHITCEKLFTGQLKLGMVNRSKNLLVLCLQVYLEPLLRVFELRCSGQIGGENISIVLIAYRPLTVEAKPDAR